MIFHHFISRELLVFRSGLLCPCFQSFFFFFLKFEKQKSFFILWFKSIYHGRSSKRCFFSVFSCSILLSLCTECVCLVFPFTLHSSIPILFSGSEWLNYSNPPHHSPIPASPSSLPTRSLPCQLAWWGGRTLDFPLWAFSGGSEDGEDKQYLPHPSKTLCSFSLNE